MTVRTDRGDEIVDGGQRGPNGGRLVHRPTATVRPHPTYQACCGPIAATRVRRVVQQRGPIREPLLTTTAGTILDGHVRSRQFLGGDVLRPATSRGAWRERSLFRQH